MNEYWLEYLDKQGKVIALRTGLSWWDIKGLLRDQNQNPYRTNNMSVRCFPREKEEEIGDDGLLRRP